MFMFPLENLARKGLKVSATGARFSNEWQRLDYLTGYYENNPSNIW